MGAVNERVLLIEDDASLRELAVMVLARAGMKATGESDGARGLERFRAEPFDLVILDVMLPTIDGFEICREIRRVSQVPIVMLTARDQPTDIVAGLELGADDYVTKPFDAGILLARARAVLRRVTTEQEQRTLTFGDLEIDAPAYKVFKRGEPVHLSSTEFRLLFELSHHAGQVLSRQTLLERVWNYDYMGDSRLVDMAIKRLRDKIEDDSGDPRHIVTVRGVGYRFDD